MGIIRILKKLSGLHISQENNASFPPPPPLNGGHHMRDGGAPPNIDYGPLPRSFFSAVNSAREQAGYDPLPVFPRGPIPTGEENSGFDRSRSKSRERPFDRSARHGSPQHFHQGGPGTPVKFRRRPISPELLQPHVSPPFLFRQNSLPASPDMNRHFQHPQQLQHIARQQQLDMMMAHPVQFIPQFQQPFYPMINPNVNMQPWFMMPQPQMHLFY